METNKYYKALELDKILDRAAGYALCSEARTRLLEQPAAQDADEARWALRQTDSMTIIGTVDFPAPLSMPAAPCDMATRK